MANYATFKKILPDSFIDNSITSSKVVSGAGVRTNTLWVYNERGLCLGACSNAGACTEQANGKCCLWTVPDKINTVTFELWSGGGAGAGNPGISNCSMKTIGGAGGNYAVKTITTLPGCQYTICAGGTWPCMCVSACVAGQGCASYAIGYNLSNFCVVGGCGGFFCASDGINPGTVMTCANCNVCGYFNADFGMMGTTGAMIGQSWAFCGGNTMITGSAPLIGMPMYNAVSEYWCSCGCYVNWPAGGGMSGVSNYCGTTNCLTAGTMGGSGIVKITYG